MFQKLFTGPYILTSHAEVNILIKTCYFGFLFLIPNVAYFVQSVPITLHKTSRMFDGL